MKDTRFFILMRDGFKCQYCKKQLANEELEIDHLFPRSMGGSDNQENLASACKPCNRQKSGKLFMPYIDIEEQRDELFGTYSTWYIHRRFGEWAIKFASPSGLVLEFQGWYHIDWHRAFEDDWISHVAKKHGRDWGPQAVADLTEGLTYFRRMIAREQPKKTARRQLP